MRCYTYEEIERYEEDLSKWLERGDELADVALSHSFKNPRAEQFSREGFVRRLNYLEHVMNRLAEIYPPNLDDASRDTVRDAEMLVQSFVMNVFGAIDNLAWVWVLERRVKRPNGKELSPSQIVFDGRQAGTLVDSLTPKLIEVVDKSRDWFKALRAYRDGVAHQIPIYIPRLLNDDERERSERLRVAIDKAIAANNRSLLGELLDELHSLGDYGALMALSGAHVPIKLHPQTVCDLATVVELGETLFAELRRLNDR